MAIKRYSPATIKTYVGLLTVFQQYIGHIPLHELDSPALLNSILRMVEHKQYTHVTNRNLMKVPSPLDFLD